MKRERPVLRMYASDKKEMLDPKSLEDCSPGVREAIDNLVKAYLENNNLTIKELIKRELPVKGGRGEID